MNMQAMMQQAQRIQKDMVKSKKEIEEEKFTTTKNFVTVVTSGTKKVDSVKINVERLDKEDIEALEDMILLAINENNEKIDEETKKKMGKFSGMAGLF